MGKRQMNRAYEELDYKKAKTDLSQLADTLESQLPGAAASLREGLQETLTVTCLGLPPLLKDTVSSTNSIERAPSPWCGRQTLEERSAGEAVVSCSADGS